MLDIRKLKKKKNPKRKDVLTADLTTKTNTMIQMTMDMVTSLIILLYLVETMSIILIKTLTTILCGSNKNMRKIKIRTSNTLKALQETIKEMQLLTELIILIKKSVLIF